MKAAVIALSLGLLACSTPPAPNAPVAGTEGTFSITRSGDTNYAGLSQLTAQATHDAQAHCAKMARKFKAVSVKETPTTPGWTPQSELVYRCE